MATEAYRSDVESSPIYEYGPCPRRIRLYQRRGPERDNPDPSGQNDPLHPEIYTPENFTAHLDRPLIELPFTWWTPFRVYPTPSGVSNPFKCIQPVRVHPTPSSEMLLPSSSPVRSSPLGPPLRSPACDAPSQRGGNEFEVHPAG